MFIKEIILDNFRIYKGQNQLTFEVSAQENIYVLSGFNGYGKTTLLTALVWGLYGRHMQEVDEIFKRKIREAGGYAGYLDANLNRAAQKEQVNSYAVTLVLSDIQIPGIVSNEVEIKRSYTLGDRQDQLEIKIDGFRNELVEDVGNEIFIQDFILPKEIAKFFFFDAEKITSIAEEQTVEQRKQLARAYSEVLGIKKYIDLKNSLMDLRLKYRRESASPEELKKLEELEGQVHELEAKITLREDLVAEFQRDQEDKEKRASEIQEKLIREGSSISMERLLALRREKSLLSDRSKEYKERFGHLLDFAPFAIAGRLFFALEAQLQEEHRYQLQNGRSLQELRSSIQTIREAFSKLPRELTRVELERELDSLLHRVMLQDDSSTKRENQVVLHDFDESLLRDFNAVADNLRTSYKEQFKLLTRDIKRNRYELNEVNKELARAESKEGDIIVQKHRKEKEALNAQIRSIQEEISGLHRQLGSLQNELNSKKKVLQELSKKLAVKHDLREKDITAARLINKLDSFIIRMQKEKKAVLEMRICKGLNSLMHKKDFVSRVSVEAAGEVLDINLYNEREEPINKADLSMGEKQLYATAILQALVEESNIEFPVFIDSPLQKLDMAHARNIITDFYPTISKQVVLLPLLEKEMTQEEYELFKPHVKDCFLILNLDEDASMFVKVDKNELFQQARELNRKADSYV